MPDRTDAFFAYLLSTAKTSWTDADKARLQALANRWIRPGALVRLNQTQPAPSTDLPPFSGSVVEIVEDDGVQKALIQLNEPIELPVSGGGTAKTDEITVPIESIELDPGASPAP